MKVKYFADTDTLHIQLSDRESAETAEVNENILTDIDRDGRAVGLTESE